MLIKYIDGPMAGQSEQQSELPDHILVLVPPDPNDDPDDLVETITYTKSAQVGQSYAEYRSDIPMDIVAVVLPGNREVDPIIQDFVERKLVQNSPATLRVNNHRDVVIGNTRYLFLHTSNDNYRVRDSLEGYIHECETKCRDCGFEDYWAYGFFESGQRGYNQSEKYG